MRVWDVDRLGKIAGTACAVHCVLSGFALGLLSVAGLGFVASETSEIAFLSLTGLLGTVALIHGIRKHHSVRPALFFVAGVASIATAHLAFDHHRGGLGTTLFSVLGGGCLVAFHVLNGRLGHSCQAACSCEEPQPSAIGMITQK